MPSSTRASATDAMANHVGTLTSPSTRADVPHRAAAGAPLLHALWRFCRRKPLGALGGVIVLVTLRRSGFAPYIAHYTYDGTSRRARMQRPSAPFCMGSDSRGRDIWSRVVYGARIPVSVGFCAVLTATVLAAG